MKAKLPFLIALCCLFSSQLFAQNSVYITEGAAPANPPIDPSALLQIDSENKGILIPRMTACEMFDIPVTVGSTGCLVFITSNDISDCDTETTPELGFNFYNGSFWAPLGSGDGGGGFWAIGGDSRLHNIGPNALTIHDEAIFHSETPNIDYFRISPIANNVDVTQVQIDAGPDGTARPIFLRNASSFHPGDGATSFGRSGNEWGNLFLTGSSNTTISQVYGSQYFVNTGLTPYVPFSGGERFAYVIANPTGVNEWDPTTSPKYFSVVSTDVEGDVNQQFLTVAGNGFVGINVPDMVTEPESPLHVFGTSTLEGDIYAPEIPMTSSLQRIVTIDNTGKLSRMNPSVLLANAQDDQQLSVNQGGLVSLEDGGQIQLPIYSYGNNVSFSNTGNFSASNNYNIRFGFELATGLTNSHMNSFIGHSAGKYFTGGDNNVFIGSQSGNYFTSGIRNIFIGYKSGPLAPQSFDDKLWIGSFGNDPLIGGNITDGEVGIGIQDPQGALHVGNHGAFIPPVFTSKVAMESVISNPAAGSMAVVDDADDNLSQEEGLWIYIAGVWRQAELN